MYPDPASKAITWTKTDRGDLHFEVATFSVIKAISLHQRWGI